MPWGECLCTQFSTTGLKGFLCLREFNSFISVHLDDDGSTFYDVYLKEVGKKDRQTKKLLDAFGTKCELHGVCVKFWICLSQIMLTSLFGWCNFPAKTYNSRNILYSYPGCFIQKQSNYELKHTYQLLGMAGTLRMRTSNPSIKDPLLPRRVQSTPLSELQCIIWLFHSDIERGNL